MINFSKSTLAAASGALLFIALAGPALANQNSPGTSNNAPNPLAVDQNFVGDYIAPADAAPMGRPIYDRHGRYLGRTVINGNS